MKSVVTLSYFHRKIGPINAYSYPESLLDEQSSMTIANIMDQTFQEGFFTHSFENLYSMNFYFEIHSDLARGNKEMLMASVIFDEQQPAAEIENVKGKIEQILSDFSKMLQSNDEIFFAFYINDLNNYEDYTDSIIEKDAKMKVYIKDLYRTVLEDTREKSEEEKIALLLSKREIFDTLNKLSKGPIKLDDLVYWFNENFVHKNFDEMIETLVDKQIINKNSLAQDTYILLLKEINAERIPTLSVIENFDIENELNNLLLPLIVEYFSEHESWNKEETLEDSHLIFQVIADPRKYNILSELRKGLIPRDKLSEIVPKRTLNSLINNFEYLKENDFIEEITFNEEKYIFLKTEFQITTDFPEFLRRVLQGKEGKPVIADKYTPKTEVMADLLKDARDNGEHHPKEKKIKSFLEDLSSSPKKDSSESKKHEDE